MISPVKSGSAARTAAGSGRDEEVAVTAPSASSVAVAAPQRTVKR